MRFHSIHLRDMGQFRRARVDFAKLGGPLIAVTGPNGAGKTTLLELLVGALYRQCPTRGSLASLASSRNAFVEVTCETGGSLYTVRQTVDKVSGKGEALVQDVLGTPVLHSGKVKEFDEWAARTFPTPEVLFASSFAVQGERGFLDLKPAERKQVLVRVLGLERLERMAEDARSRASAAKLELTTQRARLGELPKTDILDLAEAIIVAVREVEQADARVTAARAALENANEAAKDAQRAKELAKQREGAQRRLKQAQDALAHTELLIKNNKLVLGRADEIRAAVAEVARLNAEQVAANVKVGVAREEQAAAKALLDSMVLAQQRCAGEVEKARARVQRAEARLRDRAAVREAVAAVPELQEQERAAIEAVKLVELRLVELERIALSGKDERIKGLRAGIDEAAQSLEGGDLNGPDPAAVLRGTLGADNQLAEKHAAAPKDTEAARADLTLKRRHLESTRVQLSDAQRLAARAPEMDQADAEKQAADAELSERTNAARDAQTDVAIARAALKAKGTEVEDGLKLALELQRKLETHGEVAKLAPKLDAAEGRIAELEPARERDAASVEAAEAELARFPEVQPGSDNVQPQVAALEAAERHARERHQAHGRAVKALEDGEEVQARRETIERDVALATTALEDWTRLGQDLGRDGLQALEIDCAVPELNELANDLLHQCHGPRFTVTISTQRLTADGKRQVEGLDVRVLDTEGGRDAIAESYSGGECVIVGEAIALALTTLACRRAGVERPTLVRDETGAALDADNSRAYIAMLRRAAHQIGADQVLFVSHNPELQEMADARINVAELDASTDAQLELDTHEPPALSAEAGATP